MVLSRVGRRASAMRAALLLATALCGVAGCKSGPASDPSPHPSAPPNIGARPDVDAGLRGDTSHLAPLPDPASYDYRPVVAADDARLASPPAWFVRAQLLSHEQYDRRRPLTRSSVEAQWRTASLDQKWDELAATRKSWTNVWILQRDVNAPVILPVHVTNEMVKADEVPSWARGVAWDAKWWHGLSADERRSYLEEHAVTEALTRAQQWDTEHAADYRAADEAERAKVAERERAVSEAQRRQQEETQHASPPSAEDELQAALARTKAALSAYRARCDEVAKGAESAKLLDVFNSPEKYAGKTLKISATWLGTIPTRDEISPATVADDDYTQDKALLVVLAPPGRITPTLRSALFIGEYADKMDYYDALKHSRVEVIILIRADQCSGHVGHILRVRAE